MTKLIKNGMPEFVVPEEIAIKEVKDFIEHHQDETISEEQVAIDYKETVRAVMRGLLNIQEYNAPVYKLRDPILDDQGNIVYDSIPFITRIKPLTMAALQKGVDLSKDQLKMVNIMTTYYTQLGSVALLDKLSKVDYKVIQQVTGLFQ